MLLDRTGRPLGVAKVGTNELTERLVRDEHATLMLLAAVPERSFAVPSVLGTTSDPPSLVLSVEDIEHAKPLSDAVRIEIVREISRIAPGERTVLRSTRVVESALRDLADSADAAAEPLVKASVAALEAYQEPVQTGSWHGDWTGHNAGTVRGHPLVWDWERFAVGAPVGFDELHRHFQEAIGGTPTPAHVDELIDSSADILSSFEVQRDVAPGVAIAYLFVIAARYVVDGQRRHRPALGAVESWLLPPLSAHVRSLPATEWTEH
jgi:hypothetical protein